MHANNNTVAEELLYVPIQTDLTKSKINIFIDRKM